MSDDQNFPSVTPVDPAAGQVPVAPGSVPTAQAVLGTPTAPQPIAGGRRRESIAGLTQTTEQVQTPQSETPAETSVEATPESAPESPVEVAPTAPETERSAELGPELEKFVEQTEKQSDKQPPETVIAAQTMPSNVPKTVKQPVVVLPMTQKTLKLGQRKGMNTSIRWLAEWCVRQIKKFSSILVVYRENE